MGPYPDPTPLKVLKGRPESDINRGEPIPSDRPIERPAGMPEYANKLWDDLAPDLIAKGVLTHWDVAAFHAMAEQWHIYRSAVESVIDDGPTVVGYRGREVKNPSCQVARDALSQFTGLMARFGLSPVDRSRISVGSDEGRSYDDLLTGGTFG